MEQICVQWGARSYNDVDEICLLCKGNRSDKPFTDLNPNAEWRSTCITEHNDFICRFSQPLHPIVRSKYMNRHFIRLDKMHINELKGTLPIIGGSVLALLLRKASLGTNKERRLEAINRSMKQFHKDNPKVHRMPPLREGNLENNGWACLCGQTVKAANTRCLTPWFHKLAVIHFSSRSPQEKTMRKVTYCLKRIDQVIDGFFFPLSLAEQ